MIPAKIKINGWFLLMLAKIFRRVVLAFKALKRAEKMKKAT